MKSIPKFEGFYSVNKAGEVFSVCRTIVRRGGKPYRAKAVKLKPGKTKFGYPQVVLVKCGVRFTRRVHQLVAQSYLKNPQNKPQVNHINGIKTDNRPENLEWVTPIENTRHAQKNGLRGRGRSILSFADVALIRGLLIMGKPQRLIAQEFSVSASTISMIATGRNWAR